MIFLSCLIYSDFGFSVGLVFSVVFSVVFVFAVFLVGATFPVVKVLLVDGNLGPLYTSPGWQLTRVELPRRVTPLQSNVCKCLHEKNIQAGSTPLAG